MDTLTIALGPIFVAGFALQQLLELLDPWLDPLLGGRKRQVYAGIAMFYGLALAVLTPIRALQPFGVEAGWIDMFLTALFISGGTKGINDLLKWLGYQKEQAKARLSPEQIRRV
ncbi:hypothetical protein [Thermoflexus sp.]|uniref:hypothetical protein n=1 Tax=Thermoflexus sp. TaxID=1969742 RepID=UPI0035E40059